MEKTKIDKERTWIFSPVNNISLKIDLKGSILEEQLKEAIRDTINHYDMLHQKIIIDNEGNAYYQKAELFEPVIDSMGSDWREVAREQEKHPFAIDKGEFIRFFYSKAETGMTLLIIAHHIAGDGISFTYFVQDIMRAISGEKIEYKKLELYNMDKLPKEASLRAPIAWLIKYMNSKWKKTGRKFDFDDYYNMYDKYWNNRETLIYTYSLEDEMYDSICRYSIENNVTINSMITTAFIRASSELCDVGMAASIREKGFSGMGNYATGISVKYRYIEKTSFVENAKMVQKKIYDKLDDTSKRYFLLQFMRSIEPTLIDAIYFNACNAYNNKTAETFSKMFGYNGNPKGISITNLTKLPIETKYGTYEIVDFTFVPPLVLNARRIIGVASIGNKMVLSLHLNKDAEVKEHREFFYKGMEYLKNL
ncbi:hypothetical protein acsn021_07330 [Anaerocolumna cellulosilytica]|uniref:Uncharacterized protein n=1 Tax=Anaerocolumna cellulosilytica TaxID=433286 RepID=A0A6S6QRC9_9FIRM|nr:condensation domain-containing protein [Anaerocolumna cellulosilytica]MBB5197853.1 hypothetical protein [Anaerocolumna cellulosilytica]BCJ93164.1 hypothetical protein acsn021_07330 [Anaerocolumna cellulosilytica]